MKTRIVKFLKSYSFQIGNLNGKFGFSFWPVSYFSMSINILGRVFSIGKWLPSNSGGVHQYINRTGWTYHHYVKVSDEPKIWKPTWATYYGYTFGVAWYFSYILRPLRDGISREQLEVITMREIAERRRNRRVFVNPREVIDFIPPGEHTQEEPSKCGKQQPRLEIPEITRTATGCTYSWREQKNG